MNMPCRRRPRLLNGRDRGSGLIIIIIIPQRDPLNPCFGRTGPMASIIITIIIIPQRATLNPCFDGIWSLTLNLSLSDIPLVRCLNPCFDGIWSLTSQSINTATLRSILS